jgi:hypothetical protein
MYVSCLLNGSIVTSVVCFFLKEGKMLLPNPKTKILGKQEEEKKERNKKEKIRNRKTPINLLSPKQYSPV